MLFINQSFSSVRKDTTRNDYSMKSNNPSITVIGNYSYDMPLSKIEQPETKSEFIKQVINKANETIGDLSNTFFTKMGESNQTDMGIQIRYLETLVLKIHMKPKAFEMKMFAQWASHLVQIRHMLQNKIIQMNGVNGCHLYSSDMNAFTLEEQSFNDSYCSIKIENYPGLYNKEVFVSKRYFMFVCYDSSEDRDCGIAISTDEHVIFPVPSCDASYGNADKSVGLSLIIDANKISDTVFDRIFFIRPQLSGEKGQFVGIKPWTLNYSIISSPTPEDGLSSFCCGSDFWSVFKVPEQIQSKFNEIVKKVRKEFSDYRKKNPKVSAQWNVFQTAMKSKFSEEISNLYQLEKSKFRQFFKENSILPDKKNVGSKELLFDIFFNAVNSANLVCAQRAINQYGLNNGDHRISYDGIIYPVNYKSATHIAEQIKRDEIGHWCEMFKILYDYKINIVRVGKEPLNLSIAGRGSKMENSVEIKDFYLQTSGGKVAMLSNLAKMFSEECFSPGEVLRLGLKITSNAIYLYVIDGPNENENTQGTGGDLERADTRYPVRFALKNKFGKKQFFFHPDMIGVVFHTPESKFFDSEEIEKMLVLPVMRRNNNLEIIHPSDEGWVRQNDEFKTPYVNSKDQNNNSSKTSSKEYRILTLRCPYLGKDNDAKILGAQQKLVPDKDLNQGMRFVVATRQKVAERNGVLYISARIPNETWTNTFNDYVALYGPKNKDSRSESGAVSEFSINTLDAKLEIMKRIKTDLFGSDGHLLFPSTYKICIIACDFQIERMRLEAIKNGRNSVVGEYAVLSPTIGNSCKPACRLIGFHVSLGVDDRDANGLNELDRYIADVITSKIRQTKECELKKQIKQKMLEDSSTVQPVKEDVVVVFQKKQPVIAQKKDSGFSWLSPATWF